MYFLEVLYNHKETEKIIMDFETNPMSNVSQYFPRDYYLFTDYLWLDLIITVSLSFFIFLFVKIIFTKMKKTQSLH